MPTADNQKPRVAILLSHQPLQPCGNTAWVRQVVNAVQWVKEHDYILCSSTGLQTWEMITAAAAVENALIEIFGCGSDKASGAAEIAYQFGMVSDQFAFVKVPATNSRSKEAAMSQRDELIIRSADILLPISVKPGGNMCRLIEGSTSKEFVRDFEIEYASREQPLAYLLADDQLTDEIRSVSDTCITHWTRSCHCPWPNERLIDYYRAILASESYPRSAFETLRRIVTTRTILASSRHMPGNEPTVSFSALPPCDLVPLMRWRARYSQMSFEPYGIGIKREVALESGIQRVHYYEKRYESCLPDVPDWLSQSSGLRSDWRQEREFRYRGNFRFDDISPDDLILFCRTPDEAKRLHEQFGIRAVSFTSTEASSGCRATDRR